jgi:ferredoxin-NADP reductase
MDTRLSVKLLRKTHLIDNIWSFVWKGDQQYTWEAGQFIYVELPHPDPDIEGTKRWFTVSAAPFEGNLQITTRITESTFKRTLSNLPEGGEITLVDPPDGDFVWGDSARPRVFVAAGIGVTPFRSIIAQRAHNHEPLDVTLVYANRTDAAVFREEFDAIAAANPGFKVRYVTGLLTVGRLREEAPDLDESLVYISGPEPLVETLGDQLRAESFPEDQLKQDFFPNYTESNF